MNTTYFRPIAQTGRVRPASALNLAGGSCWFTHAEKLERGEPGILVAADQIHAETLAALTQPRADICGMSMAEPHLMGVLNVTPDSFSDGGKFNEAEVAVAHAVEMQSAGSDILDIGGESTRPGADFVTATDEIARTVPVIQALRGNGYVGPISIDTRKADVAQAALAAGANIVNDVSALSFDPDMVRVLKETSAPVCLMHASGDPKTMQENPQYDDVLLDVYDFLAAKVDLCVAAGIERDRIILDPGIGFGKTTEHCLALIRGLSLFHGLGCPILLGVSRKRFIGFIGDEPQAEKRAPGSISIGLEGLAQGVQMLRVHDIAETSQAVALWRAVN